MKKRLAFMLVICCIVSLFAGCTQSEQVEDVNGQQYFNATVLEIENNSILVECTENFDSSLDAGTQIEFSSLEINAKNMAQFTVGDIIRVVYNDNSVELGNPVQIDTVFGVYLLDEDGNVIPN